MPAMPSILFGIYEWPLWVGSTSRLKALLRYRFCFRFFGQRMGQQGEGSVKLIEKVYNDQGEGGDPNNS